MKLRALALSSLLVGVPFLSDCQPPPPYPATQCDSMSGETIQDGGERVQIGTSVEGQPIWAVRRGPESPHVVLAVATVHGDECAPTVAVNEVLRANPNYELHVVPMMNPDGARAHSRRNANGVDLNKDGCNRSQPETRAVLDYGRAIGADLTVWVHSPGGWWGWDGTSLARDVSAVAAWFTGLNHSGAGQRQCWEARLWQGSVGGDILFEAHAVHPQEVTYGNPRPPHRTPAQIREATQALLWGLEDRL